MDRMSKSSSDATHSFFSNSATLNGIFNSIINGVEHSIVVVPSLSIKDESIKNIVGINHYETRALWEVLNTTNPNTNIIFVSSLPISEDVIFHYLNLLPNPAESRRRVKLVSLNNNSEELTLTEKIIMDKETQLVIKELVKNSPAYLKVFMTTDDEHQLSQLLNLPLYGHDTHLNYYLTKSGNKKIFKDSEVPYCNSVEDIKSIDELKTAIIHLWESNPRSKRFMVKLDNGVSGLGNAILTPSTDFEAFFKLDTDAKMQMINSWLIGMKFQSDKITWGSFSQDIPAGCIIEVFVEGQNKISPSAQAHITPDGQVELLSTHEQILDERGLTFLGSIFPAQKSHRHILQENTLRIGKTLAKHGFIGPFSVDFMITTDENTTRVYIIEINIRQGGTTHPYQTAKLLTKAHYDQETATLKDEAGRAVFYCSNDNIVEYALKGSKVKNFLEFMQSKKITYCHDKNEGIVFHLLEAMSDVGKLGYTSIARNPSIAQENSKRVLNYINQFIIENQSELPFFQQTLA